MILALESIHFAKSSVGEKTVVQAKCNAEQNNVKVQTVRELVGHR